MPSIHFRLLGSLAGAAAAALPAAGQTQPGALVASITAAIDRGRSDSVRRFWDARVRRSPRDPAARFALATLDRLTYRHVAAESRFAALARESTDPLWRAWALLSEGLTRVQHWDPAGLAVLERAGGLADSLGDRAAETQALIGQLRILSRAVGGDSVVHTITRARRLAPPSDSSLTAITLCAEATIVRGRLTSTADSLARQGVALARAGKDRRAVGRCLMALSQVAEVAGRQSQALLALVEAVKTLEGTADADGSATANQLSAFQYVSYSFGLGNARQHALNAIELARRSGNRVVLGYARLNLAQVAIRVGDLREAGRQLDSAKVVLEALGDRFGLAARDFVAGDVAFAAGRHAEAALAYQGSLEGYRRLGAPFTQITIRLAHVAVERGDVAGAAVLLDSAAADAERKNLGGVKKDLEYYRGLLALRRGQAEEAASLFGRYRAGMPVSAFLYRLDSGFREAEALAAAGRLGPAEGMLDSAFALVEQVRTHLSDSDSTKRNVDLVKAMATNRRFEFDPDLGIATTINRLAAGGRVTSAFRFAEAERSRVLWVHLTRRGLLSRDSADVRPKGRITFPAEMQLEELRRTLDARTALLEFTTGAGGEPTTLFVLDRNRLQAFSLPSADSLAAPIQRFADVIEGGGYPRALSRTLGALLLDSALATLPPSVDRLIVLPGGPLYRLPFDALTLPDGRPVVERYAVSVAPSARLAAEWLGHAEQRAPGQVLAFGNPRFTVPGLPRLPGSAREAAMVAGAGGQVFLDREATEAALKRQIWRGVSVLHLATHARTEDWGILTSAVHLSPGHGEDGRLGPEEIVDLSVPVDLVVLSGCRTAGGVVVFGEGVQGLVTPFLEAGARAVLASYWEIGDRRIISFMERFYSGLRRGQRAGEALHAAKLASFRAGEAPAIWAAFGLTGNPDVRPLGPPNP